MSSPAPAAGGPALWRAIALLVSHTITKIGEMKRGFGLRPAACRLPDSVHVHPASRVISTGTAMETRLTLRPGMPGTKKLVARFGEYGSVGVGFIHVHHLRLMSEIRENYVVEPIRDLRPICPNCHAMIHTRKPPYTIEEMKRIMNDAT